MVDPVNSAAVHGLDPSQQASRMQPPPQGNAGQNAQWWNGLSAPQQASYVAGHAQTVGNMDGLPSEVRHAANMQVLAGDNGPGSQALLNRINASQNNPPGEQLLLLGFEPQGRGSDAKAIVAMGNPDDADNVAVFVPGTGSTVDNIGGNLDRMGDLKAQADLIDGDASTSTIVWLGYDAPNGLGNAASAGPAKDGAPALRSFTEGLRESHNGPDARVTVIGHSYGSTVVGYADRAGTGGLAVDNIIVAGSPGMGVKNAGELTIDNNRLWTAMTNDDPIRFVPNFTLGTNPVNKGFGGTRIANGGAGGHSGYWNAGSESLRNQGYIVTGNEQMVTTREFR